MESYIKNKYSLSPFLSEIFDFFGLYNVEALKHINDPDFQQSIRKYFFDNIARFVEFHDFLGIKEAELFIRENPEFNILEFLKPGEQLQLNIIVKDVIQNQTNFKSFSKKSESNRNLIEK